MQQAGPSSSWPGSLQAFRRVPGNEHEYGGHDLGAGTPRYARRSSAGALRAHVRRPVHRARSLPTREPRAVYCFRGLHGDEACAPARCRRGRHQSRAAGVRRAALRWRPRRSRSRGTHHELMRFFGPLAGWWPSSVRAFVELDDPAEQMRYWKRELNTWRFRAAVDGLFSVTALRAAPQSKQSVCPFPAPRRAFFRAPATAGERHPARTCRRGKLSRKPAARQL